MAKTTANISIDADTKRKAQELFADFGMDLSTAVNIFLRQAIREKAIPFAISKKVPNNVTLDAMHSAETGADVYGPYDSVDDVMDALNVKQRR